MKKIFFSLAVFTVLVAGGIVSEIGFAQNATAETELSENSANSTSISSESGPVGERGGDLFGLYIPQFKENESYNFRKVRWGMSPDQVEDIEGRRPTRNNTNRKSGVYRIGYKDVDLFGVDIWLMYSFIEDKLWGAGYAKDYADEGEFELIEAQALTYYGQIEPMIEGNHTEYQWSEGDTKISLRHIDDPRRGHRIFFNVISEELLPEPVERKRIFAPGS